MGAILKAQISYRDQVPATIANAALAPAASQQRGLEILREELAAVAAGVRRAAVTVSVDSATAIAATTTIVVTFADGTAGDTLDVTIPGDKAYRLTCVASGATPADGEFNLDTDDDTTAESLALAINSVPGLKDRWSAVNASGTITVTDTLLGSVGNNVTLVETEGTSTFLAITGPSGGYDEDEQPTATVTFGTPDPANGDTVVIGSTTLTFATSPSGESQMAIDGTPATDAATLVTTINAHSTLQGLISASAASAVVTLTWLGDPRAGSLIYLARTETNAGAMVLSAATLGATVATLAYNSDPRVYASGLP